MLHRSMFLPLTSIELFDQEKVMQVVRRAMQFLGIINDEMIVNKNGNFHLPALPV